MRKEKINKILNDAKGLKMTVTNMGWDSPTRIGTRLQVTDVETGKYVTVHGTVTYDYYRWGSDFVAPPEDEWRQWGTVSELAELGDRVIIEVESLGYNNKIEVIESWSL